MSRNAGYLAGRAEFSGVNICARSTQYFSGAGVRLSIYP